MNTAITENLTGKPMSPAEYRAHAQSVKGQAPTEIVTLKSGSVWELRRPDLQGMVLTGRVPQSLLLEGLAAWKKSDGVPAEAVMKQLSDEDTVNGVIFMRDIVCECTVNPHFVEFATRDNEIGAADMLRQDFEEIFAWAMGYQGVAGLDGLKTFRAGRGGAAPGARTRRKKQRVQGKQPARVG
jgi:hypothetical protein